MGAERLIPAVADAGPLIHLSEVGALDLLRAFEPIHVPREVWAECVARGPVDGDRLKALDAVRTQVLPAASVDSFVRNEDLGHLQRGEQECLLLARRESVSLVLTDDLLVRAAAARLQLTPVGSSGVIALAYHRGWIPLVTAERYLLDLQDTGLAFVTRAVVELAAQALRRGETGITPP